MLNRRKGISHKLAQFPNQDGSSGAAYSLSPVDRCARVACAWPRREFSAAPLLRDPGPARSGAEASCQRQGPASAACCKKLLRRSWSVLGCSAKHPAQKISPCLLDPSRSRCPAHPDPNHDGRCLLDLISEAGTGQCTKYFRGLNHEVQTPHHRDCVGHAVV